jgi:hypothetical protein
LVPTRTCFTLEECALYGSWRSSAWLRLVPDAEREGERTIGYRHSLRLLRRDFGRLTPLVIAAAIAIPLTACIATVAARNAYFTLAAFHGYLEIAFVAAALTRIRPPADCPRGA